MSSIAKPSEGRGVVTCKTRTFDEAFVVKLGLVLAPIVRIMVLDPVRSEKRAVFLDKVSIVEHVIFQGHARSQAKTMRSENFTKRGL